MTISSNNITNMVLVCKYQLEASSADVAGYNINVTSLTLGYLHFFRETAENNYELVQSFNHSSNSTGSLTINLREYTSSITYTYAILLIDMAAGEIPGSTTFVAEMITSASNNTNSTTNSNTTTTSNNEDDDDGLSDGAIAGIVIGCVAVVGVIVLAVTLAVHCRSKRVSRRRAPTHEKNAETGAQEGIQKNYTTLPHQPEQELNNPMQVNQAPERSFQPQYENEHLSVQA